MASQAEEQHEQENHQWNQPPGCSTRIPSPARTFVQIRAATPARPPLPETESAARSAILANSASHALNPMMNHFAIEWPEQQVLRALRKWFNHADAAWGVAEKGAGFPRARYFIHRRQKAQFERAFLAAALRLTDAMNVTVRGRSRHIERCPSTRRKLVVLSKRLPPHEFIGCDEESPRHGR
jgi:hypothetical protein